MNCFDCTTTATDRQLRMGDLAEVDWAGWSTRFVLFTGNGGVGKTTSASAAAVAMAERGSTGAARLDGSGLEPGGCVPHGHWRASASGARRARPRHHGSRPARGCRRLPGLASSVHTVVFSPMQRWQAGRGVVLVTGKGGVGKTTVAGLIAVELARRGYPVHLSSTDPAGHAAATAADLPTLATSAIDTVAEPASSPTAGSSTRPSPIPAPRTPCSNPAPRSNVPNSPASPHSQNVSGPFPGTPTSVGRLRPCRL